jgi:ribonuclease HII
MARRFDPTEIPAAPELKFERALWLQGLARVAGLDEAGRGAWAGPVAAGAVILPADEGILARLEGVRDSKQMTPAARASYAARIRLEAAAWGVGFASNEEIDALGILPATRLAMQRALAACANQAEHLLIDALRLPGVALPQTALIKGDQRSLSIAAASVLAKTGRDEWMETLDSAYPGYGFKRHKGYGTAFHQAALKKLGPSRIHRLSFAPLRALENAENPSPD